MVEKKEVEKRLVIMVGEREDTERGREIEEAVGVRGRTVTLKKTMNTFRYTERERTFIWVMLLSSLCVWLLLGRCLYTKGWVFGVFESLCYMIPVFLFCGWDVLAGSYMYSHDLRYTRVGGVSVLLACVLVVVFVVWLCYGVFEKTDALFYLFSLLGVVTLGYKEETLKFLQEGILPAYQWRYQGIETLEEITSRIVNLKYEKVGVYVETEFWYNKVRGEVLKKYPEINVYTLCDYMGEGEKVEVKLSSVVLSVVYEAFKKMLKRQDKCIYDKVWEKELQVLCSYYGLTNFEIKRRLSPYMREGLLREVERCDFNVILDFRSIPLTIQNALQYACNCAKITEVKGKPYNTFEYAVDLIPLDALWGNERDTVWLDYIKWCVTEYYGKIFRGLKHLECGYTIEFYTKYVTLWLYVWSTDKKEVPKQLRELCEYLWSSSLTEVEMRRNQTITDKLEGLIVNTVQVYPKSTLYLEVFKSNPDFCSLCGSIKNHWRAKVEYSDSEINKYR